MKEYIDRSSVLTILDDYCVIDEAYNAVKALPAAEVVEVRRGSWKIKEFAFSRCKKMICSICGYNESRGPAWDESYGLPNYCPSCGARMDKEDEHEAG